MTMLLFPAILARQSQHHQVVTFAARASEVFQFAAIDRAARSNSGELSGFQRPQVAGHIREIRDYLVEADAILPNPIVVAFTSGVIVNNLERDGRCQVAIDISEKAPGWVVDGQQRLSALSTIDKDFQLFVSAVICEDEAELRRQFVLINNTRPLPKSLIYELLPQVDGLPTRLSQRSLAADFTADLNYSPLSPLKGMIHQHTNPAGIVRDTAIQRVIMNSINDGAMRTMIAEPNGREACLLMIGDFYRAVQKTFAKDWVGHTPKTSRLVHGAGIMALGYVMDLLAELDEARDEADFVRGLECLVGRTAWTSGEWHFSNGDRRHWRAVQNVNRDIVLLAQHLIDIVREDIDRRNHRTRGNPQLKLVGALP
jgi:DGQHR domain-containing protein